MIKDKDFKKWLNDYLAKPCSNPHYDPDGNSSRAVASRGLAREIVYQYKQLLKTTIANLAQFDGLETTIGWFLLMPIYLLLCPILPIYWGFSSYRRAIKEYYDDYKAQ